MKRLTLLLLLPACASVKSSDVATSSIWADLAAVTDGDGTTATAILRVGGADSNTFVDLEEGDQIDVTAGAETVTLQEVALGDLFSYVGSLAADEAGTEFTFDFQRALLTSAPASTATMPDPFELTAPAAGAALSRAQGITVTWEPSGTDATMRVLLRSECIVDAQVDVDGDPGSYTYEPGSYLVVDGAEGQSCEATLTVQRIGFGALDPAFETGGQVYAAQERKVDFRLDP